MGDEKYYTIQIKGTAYRFRPLPSDDVTRLLLVLNMGASPAKSFKALSRVLAESAGPEQWDAITDRLIDKELTIPEVTSDIFKKIVSRQAKDEPATAEDAE